MYILDVDSSAHPWTSEQAWLLVKSLATNPSLRYNELLLSDTFKSGEPTLRALEQAELITVVSSNGRPHSIKPGKPVYQAAFKQLTSDKVLAARLDLAVLNQLIKIETGAIEKAEAELALLSSLPTEVTNRVKWLLGKLQASQGKVERYEAEGAGLKKILQREF